MLDQIRKDIDAVDTKIKELFLKRMECSRRVAETKAITGGDVFAPDREKQIIEKRAADVEEVYDEYVTFLKILMSISRRYQYGILTNMQDAVLQNALSEAGFSEEQPHNQVTVTFSCVKGQNEVNLFLNMVVLNDVPLKNMKVEVKENIQHVTMTLSGTWKEKNMRQLLCQVAKEAMDFSILSLDMVNA